MTDDDRENIQRQMRGAVMPLREVVDRTIDATLAVMAERDALAADAARYRWLRDQAREELLRPDTLGSEFADMRTHYKFPTVMAYAPYAGNISMDESIDAAIAAGEK
jgi:hypothetical protein